MHVLSFISLAGAGAAFFLTLRLWFIPTENRPAAQSLSAFLFCAALFVTDNVCYNEHAFAAVPWFYAVANPFILALGPTFHLYCRAATEPAFTWSARRLLHFLPSAIWAILDTSTYLLPIEAKLRQAALDHTDTPWPVVLFVDAYLLSYVGTACWRLWRRRDRVAEEQEEGRSHPVRGVFALASSVFVILLINSVSTLAGWTLASDTVVAFAAVVGVFSILWSITQPTRLILPLGVPPVPEPAPQPVPEAAPAPALAELPPAASTTSPAPPAPSSPTADSQANKPRLPAIEVARIAERVRNLFENDRIHLDPELSLQLLAERAKTTRHNLSYVLKEALDATFYQLVASYRVRAAAEALRAKDAASRTVADIAFECGFNTLSAFNSAFRAQFGVTPSVFREQAQEKNVRRSTAA